jgi:hypothetical protein
MRVQDHIPDIDTALNNFLLTMFRTVQCYPCVKFRPYSFSNTGTTIISNGENPGLSEQDAWSDITKTNFTFALTKLKIDKNEKFINQSRRE